MPDDESKRFAPVDESFSPHAANGQHILLDNDLLDRTALLLPEGERCIEIGAGPGALTERLLKRGGEVEAYEIDKRCAPMLGRLATTGHLNVHWRNFLDAPIEEIESSSPFHVFGNIPFHISEPLMMKLTDVRFSSAVLLVGETLVRSLTAPHPDSKSWSRMSLVSTAYFDVEKIADVSKDAFYPPPRTNAGVVRLTRKDATNSWRSDAVARSYRALVEAQATNSTVASALKKVVVTPRGDAETGNGNKRSANRRTERRVARMALSNVMSEYNAGKSYSEASKRPTSQDMLHIVSKTVDERILSKPLGGLSNHELQKICSAITANINRRKKTRPGK